MTKCPLCDPDSPGEDIRICEVHKVSLLTTPEMKKAIIDACLYALTGVIIQHHPLTRALEKAEKGI